MIDVTSIDARPGEADIVRLMADYMAKRLFTPRQRRSLSVIVDLTSQIVRVPVTRAMLGPQKSGLGTRPPKQFEMTVSTAAGIRDAAESVAHELLHISQAVNGRLLITPKKRKINGVRRVVDTARWMGGKPVTIDELAWQNRPWEIEACHWQTILVTEFLMLTTGQTAEQPVQKPKKQQLALYPVKLPVAVMPPRAQAPEFAPFTDNMQSGPDNMQSGPDSMQSGTMAETEQGAVDTEPPVMPRIDEAEAALMADLAADLALDGQFGGGSRGEAQSTAYAMSGDDADVDQLHHSNGFSARNGTDEWGTDERGDDIPGSSIEVDVPGLDEPRMLDAVAMSRKLVELRDRGLLGA